MNNEDTKKLCLSLMTADTEDEVISILKEVGLWNKSEVWRYYGDLENNFSTIGNQQSTPDAALVEKIVNSVDACLINMCLVSGIDPESFSAPQSIHEAVSRFYGDSSSDSTCTRQMREWLPKKRTEVARNITVATTGISPATGGGNPCFSIADAGEGQTPDMLPNTFLSLNASNKIRIRFVQGQFNMGGTGVLQFCGRQKLQQIISRRNPDIVRANKHAKPDDSCWGFTLVRRESPKGGRKSAVYTYLAPLNSDSRPNTGDVLRFKADSLPIFPDKNEAYKRQSAWGTLIKLYQYSVPGFRGNILRKDGALYKIELRLPDLALPVRIHECRTGFKGASGSFDTTLTGIGIRLHDDKGENMEEGFPSSSPMSVMGQQMTVAKYVFKKGKAETYRKNEGIIFTVNGQTQGFLTTDFFRRERVGLSYLRDSILVMIDCSKFDEVGRADLFMTSRDRLRTGELRKEIESVLESELKNDDNLKTLKDKRKREEIETKLEEDKPLEEVLESILKRSPSLSSLFLLGKRLSNPFKTKDVGGEPQKYAGKKYPTYFKFKGREYGAELHKECHINYRARITFEHDAENDYFSRNIDPGEFSLYLIGDINKVPVSDFAGPSLKNGIATLTVKLPDSVEIDDELKYIALVADASRITPFENIFTIKVLKEATPDGSSGGRKRNPPSKKEGQEREQPGGIALPNIVIVTEEKWEEHTPPFDKYTALRVKTDITEDGKTIYDFFINIDNIYLKTELKTASMEHDLLRAKFKYGMVLLGLALLHDHEEQKKYSEPHGDEDVNGKNIEDNIDEVTKAVAPVIIPMITTLGDLELTDPLVDLTSGEAT